MEVCYYLLTYYNTQRPHQYNHGLTPVQTEKLREEAKSLGITVEMLVLRTLNSQIQTEKTSEHPPSEISIRQQELEESLQGRRKSQDHERYLQAQQYAKLVREMLEINPDYRHLANHPLFEDFYRRIDAQEGELSKSKTPSIPGINAPKRGLSSSSPPHKKSLD